MSEQGKWAISNGYKVHNFMKFFHVSSWQQVPFELWPSLFTMSTTEDDGNSSPMLPSDESPGSSVSASLQEEYQELLKYAVVTQHFDPSRLPQTLAEAANAFSTGPDKDNLIFEDDSGKFHYLFWKFSHKASNQEAWIKVKVPEGNVHSAYWLMSVFINELAPPHVRTTQSTRSVRAAVPKFFQTQCSVFQVLLFSL